MGSSTTVKGKGTENLFFAGSFHFSHLLSAGDKVLAFVITVHRTLTGAQLWELLPTGNFHQWGHTRLLPGHASYSTVMY